MKAMLKKMVDCDVEKCERDNVRGRLRQLVYSKSTEEHEDTKKEVCCQSNKQFQTYIESQWEGCQEMWVTFKRDYNAHLG